MAQWHRLTVCGVAILGLVAAISSAVEGQAKRIEYIHPEALTNSPNSYTQVVTYRLGDTKVVKVSGQTALDATGKLVGKDDLEAQARQVFANLKAALEAADASPDDVVKINAYIVDLDPQKGGIVGKAFKEVFAGPNLPASTWVGVTSLYSPIFLLEVEAEAVVDL